MGTDKTVLEVSGQPLWFRQISRLRRLQPEKLWLSARTKPGWCPPEIEVVLDAEPSRGPLSGLVSTLARLRTTHLLALAVDLPQITVELLGILWSLAKPGCGVVPVNDGRFEPLCAIYPHEAAPLAAAALDRGELSLQNLVKALHLKQQIQTYPLSEAEQPFFLNVNTPSDLKRVRA
jgi:molybdopterin-guanine dinucleotide biosynthesis protein A